MTKINYYFVFKKDFLNLLFFILLSNNLIFKMNSSEQMSMTNYFNQRKANILRDEKIINKVNIDVVRTLSEDQKKICSEFFGNFCFCFSSSFFYY